MRFAVISANKVKNRSILALEAEYLKRFRSCKVLDLGNSENGPKRMEQEGQALLKAADKFDVVISLDENGKLLNSKEFSKLLANWSLKGKSSFALLVGGAYGLSEEVKSKSDYVFSLSPLTFPFQLARLLTIEQLYRALCMLNGHPYHKE